jgi:hypothetical protein
MRLFRQKTFHDWPTVFAEMAAALKSAESKRLITHHSSLFFVRSPPAN